MPHDGKAHIYGKMRSFSRFFRESALTLFVLGVFTDYSDPALSLDDLAFFADRFY